MEFIKSLIETNEVDKQIKPHSQTFYTYLTPRNYLLMDMQRDLEALKKTSLCFEYLQVGDKLSYNTETKEFYINHSSMLQSFSRWYNSQNREKTFYYFEKYIQDVIQFTLQCLGYIETNIVNRKINNTYEDTCKQLITFLKFLSTTIQTIVITYKDSTIEENKQQLIIDYTKIKKNIETIITQVETFLKHNDPERFSKVLFDSIQED